MVYGCARFCIENASQPKTTELAHQRSREKNVNAHLLNSINTREYQAQASNSSSSSSSRHRRRHHCRSNSNSNSRSNTSFYWIVVQFHRSQCSIHPMKLRFRFQTILFVRAPRTLAFSNENRMNRQQQQQQWQQLKYSSTACNSLTYGRP